MRDFIGEAVKGTKEFVTGVKQTELRGEDSALVRKIEAQRARREITSDEAARGVVKESAARATGEQFDRVNAKRTEREQEETQERMVKTKSDEVLRRAINEKKRAYYVHNHDAIIGWLKKYANYSDTPRELHGQGREKDARSIVNELFSDISKISNIAPEVSEELVKAYLRKHNALLTEQSVNLASV
ncbi:MAG TPA: hypothetical protein VLH19_03995 [Patescibacteria group bacterium]|nr:hypothetical protein [Patescibacteria group bacterium]